MAASFRLSAEVPYFTTPLTAASVSQETVKLFSVRLVIRTSRGRCSGDALGRINCGLPTSHKVKPSKPIKLAKLTADMAMLVFTRAANIVKILINLTLFTLVLKV